ncbi:MAG TPA: BamA/TamA family outer membrane protein [Candidatus Polarisedimenticolia bacterium]|nr:BamA/TamA family outer membrane protein [Candidatus Polarisedimenticolia bacterium]
MHRPPGCARGLGVLAAILALRPAIAAGADPASDSTIRLVPFEGAPEGARILPDAELRSRLDRALEAGCDPDRIAETLAAPYRALGYVPRVTVTCNGPGADVVLRESSHRIALLTFDPADLTALHLTAQGLEGETPLYAVPGTAPRAVLRGLLQSRAGDLYNTERYRSDRLTLARLGYALLFIPGAPAADDAYPEGALLVQSTSPRPEEGTRPDRRRNYIGGQAAYGPRAGPSAGITYARSDLLRAYDRLTFSPTFNESWGGTLQYTAPFIARNKEPHRLYDVGVAGYSTFQNNRLLDGEERDERRSGVTVSLGARPLGIRPLHELRLETSLRYEAVGIEDEPDTAHQTVLRLGVTHDYRHLWLGPSFTFRTAPAVEAALGFGDELQWIKPTIEFDWHARLGQGYEADVRLTGGGIDRPVPEFELFSLGGVSSVRGFREDTWLGRGRALTQAELWIPFARPIESRPPTPEEAAGGAPIPYEPRIARRLKAAVFLDAGTVWQTTEGTRETLWGAGVGLRFVVPDQPLIIRLDYGWGLGPDGGDAFPYVSLGYQY